MQTRTETWRTLPTHPNYQVSDAGSVRNCRFGRPVAVRKDRQGYLVVDLWKDNQRQSRFVHQLVLEAFKGPRDGLAHARHLDGNKVNNAPDNLAWGSAGENADDRVKHALQEAGLADEVLYGKARAEMARMLLDNGVSATDVRRELGYSSLQEMQQAMTPGYYVGQRRKKR
jgi:hypothetical protein